jgi:hypothetical protein
MDQGIGGEKEKLPQQPLQTSLAAEQRNKGLMAIATKATPQTGREDNKSGGHQQSQSSAILQIHSVHPPNRPIRIRTNKPNLNRKPWGDPKNQDLSGCGTRQSYFDRDSAPWSGVTREALWPHLEGEQVQSEDDCWGAERAAPFNDDEP